MKIWCKCIKSYRVSGGENIHISKTVLLTDRPMLGEVVSLMDKTWCKCHGIVVSEVSEPSFTNMSEPLVVLQRVNVLTKEAIEDVIQGHIATGWVVVRADRLTEVEKGVLNCLAPFKSNIGE